VQAGGSVTIISDICGGVIQVESGASLDLSAVIVPPHIVAATGANITRPTAAAAAAACATLAGRYTNLSDAWRAATGHGTPYHCDGPVSCSDSYYNYISTGVGGGRWYRFVGVGGDALPLSPPGDNHCGTVLGGWLSGCSEADSGPNAGEVAQTCNTPGRYPATTDGVVERIVCFDHNAPQQCYYHLVVGVVRCSNFLLWRLPNSECDPKAYCTAASGL
jgi:hypothetical protein